MAIKKKTRLSQYEKKVLKMFGKRIASVRQKKNLSVYDLTGDDMAIKSRQHWQQIEAGQKNINITTAFKLAKSLDVKMEVLVKDVGEEEDLDRDE